MAKNLTIVGAGWAGLACAVAAVQAGWQVDLFEAAHVAGGRARSLTHTFADIPLDNGQHVLLGAYEETLRLMRLVGVSPEATLLRLPLDLRYADAQGMHLPKLPAPLNVLVGVLMARGWRMQDKSKLLQACWAWQRAHFTCAPAWSVLELCEAAQLTARVIQDVMEPLCLSALNTPLASASASVFLRVLQDALLAGAGSSDLLIPKVDLGALFPQSCLRWLRAQGVQVHLGTRFTQENMSRWHDASYAARLWRSDDRLQNAGSVHHATSELQNNPSVLVLACPAWEAARLTQEIAPEWSSQTGALTHTSIATVYLQCHDPAFRGLERPMVALRSGTLGPAQFVFDRGMLCQQNGLMAAVVSAAQGDRAQLAQAVQQQVVQQLGLSQVEVVQTVVEKRATFACTPEVPIDVGQIDAPTHATHSRPDFRIADNLYACGDYVRGPYPATLEGAVRSGLQVIRHLA